MNQSQNVMAYAMTQRPFHGREIRVRVRDKVTFLSVRSGDRKIQESNSGVCDFEKVPLDQLCPSAKRD